MSFLNQPLNPQNQADLDRYWKGASNYDNVKKNMLARQWCKTHLKCIEDKTSSPYRCCSEGTERWQRIDGGPILPQDIEAMQNWWLGQVNTVTTPDAYTIQRHWLCDSSG